MAVTDTERAALRQRLRQAREELREARAERAEAARAADDARRRFLDSDVDPMKAQESREFREARQAAERLRAAGERVERAMEVELGLVNMMGEGESGGPRRPPAALGGDLAKPGAWLASIASGGAILAADDGGEGGDVNGGALTTGAVGTSATAAAFADRLARASAIMSARPTVLRIDTTEVLVPRMNGRLEPAAVVPEMEPIPEVEAPVDQLTVRPPKIAVLQVISEEAWADARPETLAGVERELIRAIADGFDRLAVYGLQDDPNLPGILGTSGVAFINAAETDDPTGLDPYLEGLAAIRAAGGEPDAIITSPATWGALSKVKRDSDSRVPLVTPEFTVANAPRLAIAGVPVYLSDVVENGTAVVLRGPELLVVERQAVEVRVAENYRFGEAAIGLRVIYRAAAVLPQGTAAAVVTGLVPGENVESGS